MGEQILRKRLAEHLGCSIDELESRGIKVQSAGIAAMPGGRPSPQSVHVMKSMGVDLTDHLSQPVSDHLVRQADLILTMTAGHRQALVSQWPELAPRTHLFALNHQDIADPIGQSEDVYRLCAEQMSQHADHWMHKIVAEISAEDE
jgi:protein-tyrosine phosphatase